MSELTREQLAASGVRPTQMAVPDGMFAQGPRDTLVVAYGFLWLFQGDVETDNNARFAFEARRQLLSLLNRDEQKRGIELARILAKANNLPFTEPH